MSYAFFYDAPGDERIYGKVKAEIGQEQPKGLLVQLVTKRHEGGLRHLNVWESKEEWERFREERVEPALAKVLAGIGVAEPPPRPPVDELDVVDVITTPGAEVDSDGGAKA
jgi:hypothetical protein